MHIKTITVGPIETNCYVVSDENTRDCAVIDPGEEASRILNYIEENHLTCRCILLTHAHFDHVGAVDAIVEETGCQVYMSQKDNGVPIGSRQEGGYTAPDGTLFIEDGDGIQVGNLLFRVIATPGHTPGSVCFRCQDALFTGDTLFRDSCGRTDFVRSDPEAMTASLVRLYTLPGEYEVFPGHMSASSLDRERRYNHYMQRAMARTH